MMFLASLRVDVIDNLETNTAEFPVVAMSCTSNLDIDSTGVSTSTRHSSDSLLAAF